MLDHLEALVEQLAAQGAALQALIDSMGGDEGVGAHRGRGEA